MLYKSVLPVQNTPPPTHPVESLEPLFSAYMYAANRPVRRNSLDGSTPRFVGRNCNNHLRQATNAAIYYLPIEVAVGKFKSERGTCIAAWGSSTAWSVCSSRAPEVFFPVFFTFSGAHIYPTLHSFLHSWLAVACAVQCCCCPALLRCRSSPLVCSCRPDWLDGWMDG